MVLMGYQITLSPQDVMRAAHAALYCQIHYYSEARVKPRDPQKLMEGWMAQQAVGKYHYLDAGYDVNEWIHTGKGDVASGHEIRCSVHRTLWIGASDEPDQRYWLVMPIKDHRFWLLGEIHREDIAHLEEPSPHRQGAACVRYSELMPHIRDVHEPIGYGRMMA
jgi:hypothetical protein